MKNTLKLLLFCISFLTFLTFPAGPIFAANEQISTNSNNTFIPKGLEKIWDPAKYISLDEIKPGMNAYCLTEYGPAGIEKFGLDVIDVVRDLDVGKNVILVKGTDERFIRTGPVAGCSGSPVYIEGRLAGALAYTWSYSTEPLYAATLIEDMLGIDQPEQSTSSKQIVLNYDFNAPINFARVNDEYKKSLIKLTQSSSGLKPLPCPLITSGFPAQASEQLKAIAEPLGLMVVSGGGNISGSADENKNIPVKPCRCGSARHFCLFSISRGEGSQCFLRRFYE